MENLDEFVKEIDPSLELIYQYSGCFTTVCKVRSHEIDYILKMGNQRGNWQVESEALVLPFLKGVNGVTQLVQDFGRINSHPIILKEYFEGHQLQEEKEITKEKFGSQIDSIYSGLKKARVVVSDIKYENFITDGNIIKLVDLGCSRRTLFGWLCGYKDMKRNFEKIFASNPNLLYSK